MSQNMTKTMTKAELEAAIAALRQENAALKVEKQAKMGLKVSAKGALSVYGLGRFPVTLYRGQWESLLDKAADIRAFIEAHASELAVKAKATETSETAAS